MTKLWRDKSCLSRWRKAPCSARGITGLKVPCRELEVAHAVAGWV